MVRLRSSTIFGRGMDSVQDPTPPEGKLPAGRHGLPAEVVAESQRQRMLSAAIEAVADSGYQETRVSDIIARAGVSRKTFYELFDDKEDCFLAAYDQELSALVEVTGEAFAAGGSSDWADQVTSGVQALLAWLSANPAAAQVCLIDVMGAGKRATAKRDTALRNFTYFVDAGRSETEDEVPGRVALGMIGAIVELIGAELTYGSAANLGGLAPDLVYLVTLPFLGPQAALEHRDKTKAKL